MVTMNSCAELKEGIEQVREDLVKTAMEHGDLLHPDLLEVSCLLDELILEHYRRMTMIGESDFKIA